MFHILSTMDFLYEARREGIPFAGHVPDAVTAREASSAGQRSFEHLIGIFEGSSTVEEELLKGPKGPGRFLATATTHHQPDCGLDDRPGARDNWPLCR